jgi:hypothetical protein
MLLDEDPEFMIRHSTLRILKHISCGWNFWWSVSVVYQ